MDNPKGLAKYHKEMQWHNPHSYLGLHALNEKESVIRIYRPHQSEVFLEVKGRMVKAFPSSVSGILEYLSKETLSSQDYRIYHPSGLLAHDPYSFLPTLGEMDTYLFNKGVHYKLYEVLGAHVTKQDGIKGVKFALWAPCAKQVFLIADFNHWDLRLNPMRSLGSSGIWELFVPGLEEKEKYKFHILTQEDRSHIKADPMGNSFELRPKNASIVTRVDDFRFTDEKWLQKRATINPHKTPLLIYEVHLGSWKKKPDGSFLNYRELAHELASYVSSMHFTHVELLPVMEHPLDESWGYQVTGFFAPTSRFGTVEDFQYFVNYLHEHNIGVILDWVPAHFPSDAHGLKQLDGSSLYEHEDPRKGFHPHWHTHIFNYARHEVSNFLIASALFWLDKMHVDGLRVDAVASMLYLDYGREMGNWIPNAFGGKENLEAIEFIKHLNAIIHEKFKGVIICAEESTSFPGISQPLETGGLGFDFKWNMGWMNDTLLYFSKDCIYRKFHHQLLTFGLLYAFSEQFLLVLSHDEVVHGKASLLSKMPGDLWQKFANLRLLYSYMVCQPGKKLLFMGGEIGVWQEWNVKAMLDWHLLDYPSHLGLKTFVEKMNAFYLNHPSLWEKDDSSEGFEWVDFADQGHSVISYLRKSSTAYLAVVHNFTPNTTENYFIRLGNLVMIREVFNTDDKSFGGSGQVDSKAQIVHTEEGKPWGFTLTLPPLATVIFEVHF